MLSSYIEVWTKWKHCWYILKCIFNDGGSMLFTVKSLIYFACRCCSNYIFIFDLTPGFNGLGKAISIREEKHLSSGGWFALYQRFDGSFYQIGFKWFITYYTGTCPMLKHSLCKHKSYLSKDGPRGIVYNFKLVYKNSVSWNGAKKIVKICHIQNNASLGPFYWMRLCHW